MNIGHSNLKPMSFLNNIKKSKRLSNNYFSLDSTKKISETIDGVQKILKIYEKTRPVIEQSLPTINNIKTTLMVAKAFKKISNQHSIEEMLDLIPDKKVEGKKIIKEKTEEKVAKPFYP